MAIRRYVAIRRDMWRCHALCVPYVSSTSLPEDSLEIETDRLREPDFYRSISYCILHRHQIERLALDGSSREVWRRRWRLGCW